MGRPKKSNRADGRYVIKRKIGNKINGESIYKYFYGHDKNEALAKYYAYLEDIKKRKDIDIPFKDALEHWLYDYKRDQVSEYTFNSTYKVHCYRHILPYFGNAMLKDITNRDIQVFFNERNYMSASLLDKLRVIIFSVFDMAMDNGYIEHNPCKRIVTKSKKDKSKKRVYDEKTLEYVYSKLGEGGIYFRILVKMGLRSSELAAMRWSKIDLENRTMRIDDATVRGVNNGKTKSETSTRILPIEDEIIYSYFENHYKKDNSLIVPTTNIQYLIRSIYEKANIEKELQLNPHELRHTCGTLMYEKTKDIYKVSRYLGHSDIVTTSNIYVHSEYQEKFTTINFKNMQ